jgi:hypothetical protein
MAAPTPLTPDEEARFYAVMSDFIARQIAENGSLRLAAVDTPERQRLFQEAAHRASELLQRPLISYSSSRGITITLSDASEPTIDRPADQPAAVARPADEPAAITPAYDGKHRRPLS